MILLIDNYDSFVYNLSRYVQEIGLTTEVVRNNKISLEAIEAIKPTHIIISPGPCTPKEAGISNQVIKHFGQSTPILGVCLGHQCIGAVYGGEIIKAKPVHGKTSKIMHNETDLFEAVPNPFNGTRYHSLVIDPNSLPPTLKVTAETEDHIIMAVQHVSHPVYGVQFHPESILTEHGHLLLRNFLKL